MVNQYHVTHDKHSEHWKVKKANAERASGSYETKQEAINAGKKFAKESNSELVIHNMDGKISEKFSYGNDPYPPKG